MQSGYVESFHERMCDELLNEALSLSIDPAPVEIATCAEGHDRERPHSSLGYKTPAEFAAKIHELRPAGSATQDIVSTALMRNKAVRF